MTTNGQTKSQLAAANVAALLRARNPLIWIATREEGRVERHLFEAAAAAKYIPYTWDCSDGLREMSGNRQGWGSVDIGEMLAVIEDRARSGQTRSVYIMRDVPPWLRDLVTCRRMRNLARLLPTIPRDSAQAIIILAPSADIPPELADHAHLIDWPLPDRGEIAAILDAAVAALPEELKATAAANGSRDLSVTAAIGMTGEKIQSNYALSLVKNRRIDPAQIATAKKELIKQSGVLEWVDPLPSGLDAIGGLDVMKRWLLDRTAAFSPAARAYGLPAPRGILVVGHPGTGKSMTAKCVPTAWSCAGMRLDMGALKGKFVGQSEQNIRLARSTAESMGRCVLWIDEIEKAMAGATQGAADGGVSADALGTLLTWMQESTAGTFFVATANNVESLPPELMRAGRFDKIFFVDLPTLEERKLILRATLRQYRQEQDINLLTVAVACPDFTGSEIASIVPTAMYAAFNDGGRAITTGDLVTAAASVVPLAITAREKIAALREWAKGRATRASSVDDAVTTAARGGRDLDV